MATKPHIRVSGTWKEVLKLYVRVSGMWKRVNKAYVRVSGVWKQFLQSAVASSFSGLFNTSAATATVTSATRTYTLGAGNTGGVRFDSVSNTGGGSFQYSLNASSFASGTITAGLVLTLVSTDTLAIRATGLTSGQYGEATIVDVDTGTVLEAAARCQRT